MKGSNKFKEIFDKSLIGILFYDKKGRLTDVNSSALEIADLQSLNIGIDLNLFDNPHIKEEELFRNGLIKFQSSLNFDNIENNCYCTPTRTKTAFIDWTVCVIDSGFLVQIQDITKQINAEEQVKERTAEFESIYKSLKENELELKNFVDDLKRSNKELERFACIASHDLQEPLRTIATFTQLLERRYKGRLDSDAIEFMEYIVDASIRMKTQIEGLLEYSRVAAKSKEFKPADTNKILKSTIEGINTLIKESSAEITAEKLPVVKCDSRQLQRVFQNLISNAVKFRKHEEPLKIHISVQKNNENKEYIFSVQDNGIGIKKQYMERVFLMFQRLHTQDTYKGTGMGLSVVKKIVEHHGGHIWVESKFGESSTFYFTLPFKGQDERF